MKRYNAFLHLFLLLCFACKEENTDRYTLNYFIDYTFSDSNADPLWSYESYMGFLHFEDTFSRTSNLSQEINRTLYRISPGLHLEMYTPVSYGGTLPGPAGTMRFSSDTLMVSHSVAPSRENTFFIACASGPFVSIRSAHPDSAYNRISEITKEKEQTYAVNGHFKIKCVFAHDTSLIYTITGKYRLPFYTGR
jgi:hypothetical protein